MPKSQQQSDSHPTATVTPQRGLETNTPSTEINTPAERTLQPTNSPQPTIVAPVNTVPNNSYQLQATLDLAAHILSTLELISYINRTDVPLNDIILVIQANREDGVFSLKELTWGDGSQIKDYQWVGHNIRILLDHSLPIGGKIEIIVGYELHLSTKLDFPGYTYRQTNLADWYPFIPPYQSNTGWMVHDPADVGENLVYDIADYKVSLQLSNAGKNVLVAASAQGNVTSSGYSYEVQSVRNFSCSISEDYLRIENNYGTIEVNAYVFSPHRQAGNILVDTIGKALGFYAATFGAYKNKSLTVVESDVPDGMEYDGLFFLGQEYFSTYQGETKSLLVSLSAHETAHQWWYALVGNDPALEPWLDEAISTYCELLFYENYYPDDVTWWWDYRINRFEPEGAVNSTIYNFRSFRLYVNAVYLRGVLFLNDIRSVIGKKEFLVVLNDYAQLYALKIANSNDFFSVFSEDTHFSPDSEKLKYFK